MLWPTMALKEPEDHYPKDSFDRFGDDLSQLVLKYLSLEDRFRFECVSKQWQRVVYQTQHELVIDHQLINKWAKRGILGRQYTDWVYLKTILTNKCPNIRSIDLHRNHMNYNAIYKIMDLLAKWCPNIRSFEVHSTHSESHTDLYGLIDRIVIFSELRHLTIDCPHVYGDSNPCANVMNKLDDNCRHIRSLGMNVDCYVSANLFNILRDTKLFPDLLRLRLGLYCLNYNESKQISVKPLLECRRLRYVWLDCSEDMDFKDVDRLRRQVRQVTTTKNGPQW